MGSVTVERWHHRYRERKLAERANAACPRALSIDKDFFTTLEDWPVEIARIWRFRRSNGITEGFHTKMAMISRRAFGFKNFDNFRLRARACCC